MHTDEPSQACKQLADIWPHAIFSLLPCIALYSNVLPLHAPVLYCSTTRTRTASSWRERWWSHQRVRVKGVKRVKKVTHAPKGEGGVGWHTFAHNINIACASHAHVIGWPRGASATTVRALWILEFSPGVPHPYRAVPQLLPTRLYHRVMPVCFPCRRAAGDNQGR
jgi:hypothetical protein